MTWRVAAALGLAVLAAAVPARSQAPDLSERLASPSSEEQRKALDEVLARSSSVAAADLFMAAAAAMDRDRVEDAGFLLYAAQVRARVDLERFPSTAPAGDDPAALLGALSKEIGEPLNGRLMRAPELFRAALVRVRAWDPLAPEGYDPGWEHGAPLPGAEARALADRAKADVLKPAEDMARLLEVPEYLEAFKRIEGFSLATADPLDARVAQVRQAEKTMRAIEKRMGIAGLFSMPDSARAAAAAARPAPAATPAGAPRRVGATVKQPRRLKFVAPTTPPDLPREVPRMVTLELTVDAQGRVIDASVLKGHPAVDQAVARAVSQWLYEPALEFGQPVPVVFTVTVNLN